MTELPDNFARWFASRGWSPRAHQLELLKTARAGRSALLIAPTGAGKTLAGFLPSLVELSDGASSARSTFSPRARSAPLPPRSGGEGSGVGGVQRSHLVRRLLKRPPPPTPPHHSLRSWGEGSAPRLRHRSNRKLISTGRGIRRSGGLHTLYISPLKALAVDIARNLERPLADMQLPIRIETRTGDTPASKRQRQRRDPPDILLTTPEQLALLLASDDAPFLFGSLRRVILDELHSLVMSKRGDLLSLGLARLFAMAPALSTIGLSATVAEPDDLRRYLVPQTRRRPARRSRARRPRRRAAYHHARQRGARAVGRALGAPFARRDLRADQAPQDHARLRQHAQPGRGDLPAAVGHQRRQSRDRAASRLARCRPAPQGRGRDGGGPPARGGVYLLARPRHRLGRRRSRGQCRRAEGRLAPVAAHRPCQSPHGRALARRAGAGEPLRGAGMHRRDRGRRGQRAGHAAAAHRRARCAGAARSRLRLRRAVSGG